MTFTNYLIDFQKPKLNTYRTISNLIIFKNSLSKKILKYFIGIFLK